MNKKRLGQHFLISRNVSEKIIQFAGIQPDDTVIEIGPGKGALTSALVETGAHIIAVELDSYLCGLLHEKYSATQTITILNEDILSLSLQELTQQYALRNRKIILMGNIPFSISSPLLNMLIEEHQCIHYAVLMFQKEFADRLLATADESAYGKLSVIVDLYFERSFGLNVKRTMFHPPPHIDASVIKLTPKNRFTIPVLESETGNFKEFLVSCFAHKRKTLINSLFASFSRTTVTISKDELAKALQEIQLAAGIRAEQMNLEQFWMLFSRLKHIIITHSAVFNQESR